MRGLFINRETVFTKLVSIIILLSVFSFVSCTSPSQVGVLNLAESIMDEHPDSALLIIRAIDTLSLRPKSVAAKYSLLHAMALDKNYIDTTNVNVILPAVNYYRKHGTPQERFKAYYYLGRIQYNAGDYSDAAVSFTKAESLDDVVEDYKAKGLLYMAFADIYNKTMNRSKEEEYVKHGIDAFEKADDVRHCNLSSGRLAIIKYSGHEWHSADSLFQVGIERAREDTVAMFVFLSNYARMKVLQPNPDPYGSIELLKEIVAYKRPLSLRDYGVWAYAASLTGDEKTCSQIENQLKRLNEPQNTNILFWLYKIEQHRGNYQKALDYYIRSNSYNSQLIDSLLSDTIGQALQNYYSLEALNSKREVQILKLRLLLGALGLCLIFIIIFVHLKNKKDKREKEVERLLKIGAESNKLLAQANENLKGQVTTLKSSAGEMERTLADLREAYVSTYKDKFSSIGELCNAYIDSNLRYDRESYIFKRVEKLIEYISDDDKLHARFENQINKDLNDIVKHLKADLGDVDKKDSRFICYCIVGFAPEMIGSLLNLSVSNVYTKKSRLKERIRGLDSPYKDEYLRML